MNCGHRSRDQRKRVPTLQHEMVIERRICEKRLEYPLSNTVGSPTGAAVKCLPQKRIEPWRPVMRRVFHTLPPEITIVTRRTSGDQTASASSGLYRRFAQVSARGSDSAFAFPYLLTSFWGSGYRLIALAQELITPLRQTPVSGERCRSCCSFRPRAYRPIRGRTSPAGRRR